MKYAPDVARSIKQATTGLRVSDRNWRSSSAMMSHVVTLPPGLLIRSRTAATCGSRAAASSLSRNADSGLSPTAYRLPKFWLSSRPSTSIRAIRAQGAGDLPGRTTVAVISPGSTAEGILTSNAPLTVASATTLALASPRNVAATGKTWPQPAKPDETRQKPGDGNRSAWKSVDFAAIRHAASCRGTSFARHIVHPVRIRSDAAGNEVELFFTIDPAAGKLVLNTTTFGTTRATPMLTLHHLAGGLLRGPGARSSLPTLRTPSSSRCSTRASRPADRRFTLPAPRLVDGQDADAQRAALREVAGSDRALDDLLRDSVTAPYIIKVHDVKTSGATIRAADLWFVVHADLKQVDPRPGSRSHRSEGSRGGQHVVSDPAS